MVVLNVSRIVCTNTKVNQASGGHCAALCSAPSWIHHQIFDWVSPLSRQLSGACSLYLICEETKEDPTIPTIPRTTDTAAYDRAWPCQPSPISITINNITDYYKETLEENLHLLSCLREHYGHYGLIRNWESASLLSVNFVKYLFFIKVSKPTPSYSVTVMWLWQYELCNA